MENSVVIDETKLTIKTKIQLTAQARRAHVRAYQASGESMVAYCEKNHLALSTFKSWVTKCGEKKIAPNFIPVVTKNIQQSSQSKPVAFCNIEIHARGIKFVIPEIADTNSLIQLIQGLSHATHQIERPVCMDI
jgi:hypothetical protein